MKYIKSFILYYIVVLCIFLFVQKPFFLLYNLDKTGTCSFSDIFNIYYHGLTLDIASTGYIVALPMLSLLFKNIFPRLGVNRFLAGYNIFVAVILSTITVVDASLYEFWEFKLDSTAFLYLDDPKNAFASVSVGYILLRLFVIVIFSILIFILLQTTTKGICSIQNVKKRCWVSLCLLIFSGLTFVGIRGIEIWPNTPSNVFYSNNTYFNHAALNPMFNVFYTLTKIDDFDKKYKYFNDEEVNNEISVLFPRKGTPMRQLVTKQRPNIVLIALEGFGSLFIESLGGMREVAPNMSKIVDESISFDSCYCSSFRTDRGIVSLLSGYLGQPTTSIMRYTRKVKSLPGLPKSLKDIGYKTTVLYGGDMSFFNMSDYFIAVGHDRLIGKDYFPKELHTTKWGVTDEDCFDWLLNDIENMNKANDPFYTTFLTLSSHVPFDVPYHRLDDEKLNGFAYTDECIGKFMNKLKESTAWKNLLVVITADHGFNHRKVASADFPFIPFLLTGGVVTEPEHIKTLVSQTDIAATILGQLGIEHEDYPFSRDVMADTYTYPFAFNSFNDGFNFRDSTGCIVFDNIADKAIVGADKERERKGKVILQALYNDISAR